LVNSPKFEDFKLHIEFICGAATRSKSKPILWPSPTAITRRSVWLLGSTLEQPRKPGVWQTFAVTLPGQYVTAVQNGITVIDNKEIPGIKGGALDGDEGLPSNLINSWRGSHNCLR
jgi:hypothetical protein